MICPVAEFIVPDWGDKVDFGIELSYRPASLRIRSLAGCDNPMPVSTLFPQSGAMNLVKSFAKSATHPPPSTQHKKGNMLRTESSDFKDF
jgi:hypothetical protein